VRIRNIVKTLFVLITAISLGGVFGINAANASVPQMNLCLAGNYATLSYVLTNAADVVVRSDTPGTLIGASSPVEADGFLHPGDNLVSQHSSADYVAAMGSLRGAIDSVKTNILPHATILNSDSLANAEIIPGRLGVFPAGIYATTAAMFLAANKQITLTGDANAVFVFISGEAFNVGANVQILLSGGAQAKNVYWIVGTFVGAHTAGASSTLVGNYLVDGTMSVGASTQITGRILAIDTITFGAGARLNALPPATSCGASLIAPVDERNIEFTDFTLVAGTRGAVYSDFVAARTLLNGSPNNQTVAYSISPSLSSYGLSFSTAGVVTGTVSSTAPVGTGLFTVTATSSGYVSQSHVYAFEIQAAAVIPDVKNIEFTDLTLVAGTRGAVYSDFVAARTLLNGSPNNQTVTYSISPSLSSYGLSFSTAGVVTGTVSSTAPVGTGLFTVTATSSGYVSQSYVYTFEIRASEVSPPADVRSIEFTDVDLVAGTRGAVYSDSVVARTLLNGSANNQTVTHSISPAMDYLGLSFSAAGIVTGTVLSTATVGTHMFTVTASSLGHISQSYVHAFVVKAAAVIPDVKSIQFTDFTLVAGIKGESYRDFVAARTLLNGSPNNQTVTYEVSPSMDHLGLSLSAAGVVAGTVSATATVGTELFMVTASSPGFISQSYIYSIEIKPTAVGPLVAVKSIQFTDFTLVAATRGRPYRDFVAASTALNGSPNNQKVTYSISPSLTPYGLSLSDDGFVTGTVLSSATVGTKLFTVTASSPGYIPQSFIYSFEIKGGVSSFKSIRSTVYFEPRSSKLLVVEQRRLLKLIGKVAPKVTDGAIFGYVQENGQTANYRKLSTARARVLAKFFKDHGVTARLQTQGKGALNPNPSARKVTFTLRYAR